MSQAELLRSIVYEIHDYEIHDCSLTTDRKLSEVCVFPKLKKVRSTIELEIYFRHIAKVKRADELSVDGLLEFWDDEKIKMLELETPALIANTGTGYLRFADYELNLIFYVFCFEKGIFTGIGTVISSEDLTLAKIASSLSEFLALILTPNFDFHEPL